MNAKDLDAIMDKLTHIREQKKQIALTKAQAEIQTIQRETEAYWDGMWDFCKAVKELLPKGKDGADNA
jgi:hypothetical protein